MKTYKITINTKELKKITKKISLGAFALTALVTCNYSANNAQAYATYGMCARNLEEVEESAEASGSCEYNAQYYNYYIEL